MMPKGSPASISSFRYLLRVFLLLYVEFAAFAWLRNLGCATPRHVWPTLSHNVCTGTRNADSDQINCSKTYSTPCQLLGEITKILSVISAKSLTYPSPTPPSGANAPPIHASHNIKSKSSSQISSSRVRLSSRNSCSEMWLCRSQISAATATTTAKVHSQG